MFTLVSFFIFAADQLIKFIVNKYMYANQSIPLLRNVFHITYVQNKGAAFGLFSGWRSILLLIGFAVVALILYFNAKLKKKDHLHLPLAFILGGSLGNLADRLFRHYVVDYLDFRVWPVFNLADIMINIGFAVIIYQMFFDKEEQKEIFK